jgi:predicted GNAT family N-acyltransferase
VVIAEGPLLEEAFRVRRAVFVEEQAVPPEEEWDELDAVATHFAALSEGVGVVGTARLVREGTAGRVGRMAVLKEWRRQGVGAALMEAVLHHAEDLGLETLFLHAQTHAKDFYARFGFRPEGDLFYEAGIEHVKMGRRVVGS